MSIYIFDKGFPYSAIICADTAEQARETYFVEVCEPNGEFWGEEFPVEITKESALEKIGNDVDGIKYLDAALESGVASIVAIDASLV